MESLDVLSEMFSLSFVLLNAHDLLLEQDFLFCLALQLFLQRSDAVPVELYLLQNQFLVYSGGLTPLHCLLRLPLKFQTLFCFFLNLQIQLGNFTIEQNNLGVQPSILFLPSFIFPLHHSYLGISIPNIFDALCQLCFKIKNSIHIGSRLKGHCVIRNLLLVRKVLILQNLTVFVLKLFHEHANEYNISFNFDKQNMQAPLRKHLQPSRSEKSLLPLQPLIKGLTDLAQTIKQLNTNKKDLLKKTGTRKALKTGSPKQREPLLSKEKEKVLQVGIPNTQEKPTDSQKKELVQRIELMEVQYGSREQKLRMDIELNKLRKAIMLNNSLEVARQTNEVLGLVNKFHSQIMSRQLETEDKLARLERDYKSLEHIYERDINGKNQSYQNVAKLNQQLEEELRSLNQQKIKEAAKEKSKDKELFEDQIEQIQQLEDALSEMTIGRREAEGRCIAYQRSLQKITQEKIMFEEDLVYFRTESSRMKTQQKEIEKMYEDQAAVHKEAIRKFTDQLELLSKERNRWQQECNSRRRDSQQIQQLQTQKTILMREVQDLRAAHTTALASINEQRVQLHDAQKKSISLQSDVFKLKTENQTLLKSNRYCKEELTSLNEEVEQMRILSSQIRHNKHQKENQLKSQEGKMRALDDIHNLIRKHKEDVQGLTD